MSKNKIKAVVIGLGNRGSSLYKYVFKNYTDVDYVGVCDVYPDRTEAIADYMVNEGRPRPKCYVDYKACIDELKPDVALVVTSWDFHIPISIYAMERGVAVSCEVGGAYSIQALWKLVRCHERTKTPIMLMENCCYGRLELLALNMKRMGLLGRVVHCDGGYAHDIRSEVGYGEENRHYRKAQYLNRNTDNYPTHEIGPIAKLLDINCGNRFLSLYSIGSLSAGLKRYAETRNIASCKGLDFNQSDVVSTLIKCQNGETVSIVLDTSLPRFYSRHFTVHGTDGLITEDNQSVFIDGKYDKEEWDWTGQYKNVEEYYKKYDHRLWKNYTPGEEGHGGIDKLVYDAFFNAYKKGTPMPIDVYDMATWMSITVLSEQSLATGLPVYFPDFTDGAWIHRKNQFEL